MCGTGAKESVSIANELFAELQRAFQAAEKRLELRSAVDQGNVAQVLAVEV
jgi:hypothetical protein